MEEMHGQMSTRERGVRTEVSTSSNRLERRAHNLMNSEPGRRGATGERHTGRGTPRVSEPLHSQEETVLLIYM